MKRQIVLLVILAVVLAACGTPRNVSLTTETGSNEGFVPVKTPEAMAPEAQADTESSTSEIEVEKVEVVQPFCGKGHTQLTDRSVLGTFPGECFFLFEGTIPDDQTLEVADPGRVHQIWVLPVNMEALLSASARGSFWMIQYGWDPSLGAEQFLAAKCSQEPPITGAVMRWLEEGTLQGEDRPCQ